DICHSPDIGFQVLDRITDHRRRGRIRAMCGIGYQNLLARSALGLMVGAYHQQSSEFAVRASSRLQRDCIHTSNFKKAVTQGFYNAQRTLRNWLRLVWVPVSQT